MSVRSANLGSTLLAPCERGFFINAFFTGVDWRQGKNQSLAGWGAGTATAVRFLHPEEYSGRSWTGGMENAMNCMENPPICEVQA